MGTDSNSPIDLSMIKLIFGFMRAKHPLAASIPREASLSLCKSLRQRLNAGEKELDFSPISLKILETLLLDCEVNISDIETMMLIRELAAYIGEVMVRHTDGQWVLLDESIWGTRLEYNGKWTLLKENKKRSITAVSYTLADIAASAWQNALKKKSPQLQQVFYEIQRKEMKEKLTYTK